MACIRCTKSNRFCSVWRHDERMCCTMPSVIRTSTRYRRLRDGISIRRTASGRQLWMWKRVSCDEADARDGLPTAAKRHRVRCRRVYRAAVAASQAHRGRPRNDRSGGSPRCAATPRGCIRIRFEGAEQRGQRACAVRRPPLPFGANAPPRGPCALDRRGRVRIVPVRTVRRQEEAPRAFRSPVHFGVLVWTGVVPLNDTPQPTKANICIYIMLAPDADPTPRCVQAFLRGMDQAILLSEG